MTATRPYTPRIVAVFDFDRTLASDSIDAILALFDTTRDDWERAWNEPLGEGWDGIIRRGRALMAFCEHHGRPLSIGLLEQAAERVEVYPGVFDMPARLRAAAAEVHEGIEVEVIALSSGYAEIVKAALGGAFDRVYASTFSFGEDGRATGIKRIVGHAVKALYLEAIGKGIDVDGQNAPEQAGKPVDEHERHCPFDQMLYVGDGQSDLQAFGFLEGAGGLAIAIDKSSHFSAAHAQSPDQRVENLAPPDFREGTEITRSLDHAVRAAAHRIALRAMGRGE